VKPLGRKKSQQEKHYEDNSLHSKRHNPQTKALLSQVDEEEDS
jgi:hypothetical protein